jgi:hypothetical protein
MATDEHDLGDGVYFRWLAFAPDRNLNPQYAHLPDNDRTGIIVGHFHPEGVCAAHRDLNWQLNGGCNTDPELCTNRCEGGVLFDTPENHRGTSDPPLWQVISLDPLHIEPSILMTPGKGGCGLHGFIRDGRWVPA